MMDVLDTGIKHLSLLNEVGQAIAEVSQLLAHRRKLSADNVIFEAQLCRESCHEYRIHDPRGTLSDVLHTTTQE